MQCAFAVLPSVACPALLYISIIIIIIIIIISNL
jgi:hypothetical protein